MPEVQFAVTTSRTISRMAHGRFTVGPRADPMKLAWRQAPSASHNTSASRRSTVEDASDNREAVEVLVAKLLSMPLSRPGADAVFAVHCGARRDRRDVPTRRYASTIASPSTDRVDRGSPRRLPRARSNHGDRSGGRTQRREVPITCSISGTAGTDDPEPEAAKRDRTGRTSSTSVDAWSKANVLNGLRPCPTAAQGGGGEWRRKPRDSRRAAHRLSQCRTSLTCTAKAGAAAT